MRAFARLTFVCAFTFSAIVGIRARAQTVPSADHHAHLQSPTAARLLNEGAKQTGAGAQEEKPQFAAELIAQLDAAGVRRAVALSDAYRLGSPFVHVAHEAEAADDENAWTLAQVRAYPDRLVGFCSVNPLRPYALATVRRCAAMGLRGGLKIHLANAAFRFEDDAQVRRLAAVFALADRLRMPILIHLRSDEVWNAKQSVRVFMSKVLPLASHVPVQVAHVGGWGGYDRVTNDALATFDSACARRRSVCDRLYFDISAVVLSAAMATAAPGSDERMLWDEQKDFTEGPEKLAGHLRSIGLTHVLFGTDWPNTTARAYIALLRQHLRLSARELDQVFSNVAPYFDPSER